MGWLAAVVGLALGAEGAGETVSPPVTVGALRAALPAGTVIRYQIAAGGQPPVEETWRFVAADAVGCTIVTTTGVTTTGADSSEARHEWAELHGHAVFPAAATTVADDHLQVPAGEFDTWRYRTTRDGEATELHFARTLPGPPLSMVSTGADGAETMRMTMLSRTVEGVPGWTDPAAEALAARVAARAGDPTKEPGLTFTFVAGDTRRTHRWDVPGGRISVEWTDEGKACRAVTTVGYSGPDAVQQEAWAAFVNDQYWLLAAAKVLDAGVVRTADGQDLRLFFSGVGLTPGDRYLLSTDADGDVTGWTYTLESGRSGQWTWSEPVVVGGLHLSLERHKVGGDRVIRFEGVASGRVALGPDGGGCDP